jgi:GDPmannose 4,6-dehydratase
MLNQEIYNDNYNGFPEEYVFSSNETPTIKEFVELAFKCVDIICYWENKVDILFGNSNRARKELQWKPNVSFIQLIEKTVKNDMN